MLVASHTVLNICSPYEWLQVNLQLLVSVIAVVAGAVVVAA